MRRLAKKILQDSNCKILRKLYLSFKRKQNYIFFCRMYREDMKRYLKYSRTFGNDNPIKMIGSIVLQYHVIEKGLTMPVPRPGFGKDRIISLCQECLSYIEQYGQTDEQLNHAIGVIFEYENYHEGMNYSLDDDVKTSINKLKTSIRNRVDSTSQIQTTNSDFFNHINSAFHDFSNSRASVRNFSEEDLPLSQVQHALELARNTPSACNRQSWRTYVYTDKQIIAKLLEAQGGNRGFGHQTNKLIVITGELGVFCYASERNQVYIDGGIYAMNLLYALHSNEVAACILNCSFNYNKEQEIKRFGRIKESEVLIAMIACGVAPNQFKISSSLRYSLEKTNTVIN